jgi:hypothetical protein
VAYAPVLVLFAAIGYPVQRRDVRVLHAVVLLGLLFAFSRPINVNHGGSPGMTRYALWLLACLAPLVVAGAGRLSRRRPVLTFAAIVVSMGMSWFAFRPSLVDRGGDAPNYAGAMLWSRWPAFDNPLPEVFAERVAGVDGSPPVPVAMPGCVKALVRGDAAGVWWPFPCEPREAPPHCQASGALCYVNGDRFIAAPRQPLFGYDPVPEHSWRLGDQDRLSAILLRLGEGARFVRLGAVRRTDGGEDILALYIVEGASGTAIWVQPAKPAGAFLRVRVDRPSVIEIQDEASGAPPETSRAAPGSHIVRLAGPSRRLVLVTDAPTAARDRP